MAGQENAMAAEQKDTEQNALAARLKRIWQDFKEGKLISYKMMAILLIVVAGLGTWLYISSASRKAESQRWLELDQANSPSRLEELIAREKDSIPAKIAELQMARARLGREGLTRMTESTPGIQEKAVASIEKARGEFTALLEKFKDDLTTRAQCLWALAMAEEALIGVPKDAAAATGPGPVAPAAEFKGQVDELLKYLKQVAALQDGNPNIEIPWAKTAAERVKTIEKDPEQFRATVHRLYNPGPVAPKLDPIDPNFNPFGPIAPKKN